MKKKFTVIIAGIIIASISFSSIGTLSANASNETDVNLESPTPDDKDLEVSSEAVDSTESEISAANPTKQSTYSEIQASAELLERTENHNEVTSSEEVSKQLASDRSSFSLSNEGSSNTVQNGDYTFTLNPATREAEIQKYIGMEQKIVTPPTIQSNGLDYKVTSIGENAFSHTSNLTRSHFQREFE